MNEQPRVQYVQQARPEVWGWEDVLKSIVKWIFGIFFDYREATLYVGIIVGSTIAVGVLAQSVVFVVIVAASLIFGPLIFVRNGWDEIRGYFRKGRERRRLNNFRRAWPRLMEVLGWDEPQPSGSRRMPELIDVEAHPNGLSWVVALKPLPSQPGRRWAEMADQLRRHYEAHQVDWNEVRPGVLAVELTFVPLPDVVEDERISVAADEWDEISLGVNGTGDVTMWKLTEVPHLLVSGKTNSGKGGVLRLVMRHGLDHGADVRVINPRRSGEYRWASQRGATVVNTLDEAVSVLDSTYDEVNRRQDEVEALGLSSWLKAPNRMGWSPIVVVVDDAPVFLTVNSADKEQAAMQKQVGTLLANIAAVGRAVGVHLVVAIQRPDVAGLGPAGGQLRNNIEGRIAVGSLDREGVGMMFGTLDDAGDVSRWLDGHKGRAVVSSLSAGATDIYAIQVYLVDEERLLDVSSFMVNDVVEGDDMEVGEIVLRPKFKPYDPHGDQAQSRESAA